MLYESNFTIVLNPEDRIKVFYRYEEDDESQTVSVLRVMRNGSIVDPDELSKNHRCEIHHAIKMHLIEPTSSVVH